MEINHKLYEDIAYFIKVNDYKSMDTDDFIKKINRFLKGRGYGMENNQSNDVTKAGIAAIAAASSTPFKTAFKVSMGIAAAQFVVLLMFLGGIAATVLATTYFLTHK